MEQLIKSKSIMQKTGKEDGILSESHFNIIFSLSQVEPAQDGRQPGVEICRLATPGRCIKLWRFETGTRLLNEGGGGSAVVVEWELMMSFAVR